MNFEQWLETRPYRNLLSEGTIKLMRGAWDASREQVIPVIVDKVVLGEERIEYRMRGDIHE